MCLSPKGDDIFPRGYIEPFEENYKIVNNFITLQREIWNKVAFYGLGTKTCKWFSQSNVNQILLSVKH